jgi:hypothetical protein
MLIGDLYTIYYSLLLALLPGTDVIACQKGIDGDICHCARS